MTKRYDEYKDSGIEWLGEIPSHWGVTTFKNKLIKNNGGCWGEVSEENNPKSIMAVRSTEQTLDGKWKIKNPAYIIPEGDISRFYLKSGDLLLTKSSGSLSHIGKTTLVENKTFLTDTVYSNFMQRLRFNSNINPKLMYYFINSNAFKEQVNFFGTTTTGLININASLLNGFYMPFFGKEEQKSIATYLDNKTSKIDSAVAELEKQKSLLIELKKSTIHQAVTKGLDLTVPMKDSGVEWIGEVPSHWGFSKMNNLFTFEKGKNAQMYNKDYILDEKKSGKYPVYSGQTENFGVMGKINTYEYDFNSVIFVTTVGAKFMTPSYLSGKFSLSQNCLLIKNRKNIENKYYFYFLMAQFTEERKKIACIIQPSLRIEDLKKLTNLRPKKSEQIKIANYLDSFVNKTNTAIRELDNQISKMKEYKKTLINDVVTGKIKVVD